MIFSEEAPRGPAEGPGPQFGNHSAEQSHGFDPRLRVPDQGTEPPPPAPGGATKTLHCDIISGSRQSEAAGSTPRIIAAAELPSKALSCRYISVYLQALRGNPTTECKLDNKVIFIFVFIGFDLDIETPIIPRGSLERRRVDLLRVCGSERRKRRSSAERNKRQGDSETERIHFSSVRKHQSIKSDRKI